MGVPKTLGCCCLSSSSLHCIPLSYLHPTHYTGNMGSGHAWFKRSYCRARSDKGIETGITCQRRYIGFLVHLAQQHALKYVELLSELEWWLSEQVRGETKQLLGYLLWCCWHFHPKEGQGLVVPTPTKQWNILKQLVSQKQKGLHVVR